MDIKALDIANYYYNFIIQSSLNGLSFSTKEGKLDSTQIENETINKLNYFHINKNETIKQKINDNVSYFIKLIDIIEKKKEQDKYKIVFFPFTFEFTKSSDDRKDLYITSPIYFVFDIQLENIRESINNLAKISKNYTLDNEIEIFKDTQLFFNNLFAKSSIEVIDKERIEKYYENLEKGEIDREYPIKNFDFYKNILSEYLDIQSTESFENIIRTFHNQIKNINTKYKDTISDLSYKSTIALIETESLIESDKINGGLLKAYKSSILPFLEKYPNTDDKLVRILFSHQKRCIDKAFYPQSEYNNFHFDTMKLIELQKKQLGSFNSKFSLTLSQRYAMNAYLSPLEIIPVNGPPGTGKTALLRAIFSNYIVDNAFNAKESYDGLKNEPYKLINTGKPILGTSSVGQAINNIIEGISGGFADEKKAGLSSSRWLKLPHYPLKTPIDLISKDIVVPQLKSKKNEYDSSTNILYTNLETIYGYIGDLYETKNIKHIEYSYIENAKKVLSLSNNITTNAIIENLYNEMNTLKNSINDKIDKDSSRYKKQYSKLERFKELYLIKDISIESYIENKNQLSIYKEYVEYIENRLKDTNLINDINICEDKYNNYLNSLKNRYENKYNEIYLLKNSFSKEYLDKIDKVISNYTIQIISQINTLIDDYNIVYKELVEIGFFKKLINKLTGREKKLKQVISKYTQESKYETINNQIDDLVRIKINQNSIYTIEHKGTTDDIANKYFLLIQKDVRSKIVNLVPIIRNYLEKISTSSELLIPIKQLNFEENKTNLFKSYQKAYQDDLDRKLNILINEYQKEQKDKLQKLQQDITNQVSKYNLTNLLKNLEFNKIKNNFMTIITSEVQNVLNPYKRIIIEANDLGFNTFLSDLEKEKTNFEENFAELDKNERFKLFFSSLHLLEGLFIINLKRLNKIHHSLNLRCPLCFNKIQNNKSYFNCENQKSKKIEGEWKEVGICKFKLFKKDKYKNIDLEKIDDLSDLLKNRLKQNNKVYGIQLYKGKYKVVETYKINKLNNLHIITPLFPMLTVTMHALFGSFKEEVNGIQKLRKNFFDLTLSDESGMILSPVALPALYNTKRMVIVGDEKQIEPVYPFDKKIDKRIIETISKKLDYDTFYERYSVINNNFIKIANKSTYINYSGIKEHEDNSLWLKEHFRCKDEIINYCNKIIYKGILIPKVRENSKNKNLYLDNNENFKSLMLFNIESNVKNNSSESEALKISEFLKNNISTLTEIYNNNSNSNIDISDFYKHIGIVTPFNNQKKMINDKLPKENNLNKILVGTVHAFQGSERDIIIFSPVIDKTCTYKHFTNSDYGNMMNVAVSRAKNAFWIFGSSSGMQSAGEYTKKLVEYIKENEYGVIQ